MASEPGVNIMRTVFIILSVFIFFGRSIANAAPPVLHFSDIVSGPKTGLGDGLGDGAIVTIWGNNLGSSQGTSTLTVCGTNPAHIYTWQNADSTGTAGPSDLYTYHKMQEIVFSIPASCSTGATTIAVTVNGQTSNTLPFTVRSGNIYHVKTNGNDSNNGSWGSPWRTISNKFEGLTAGDTVYLHDKVQEINTYVSSNRTSGIRLRGANGTAANPISLIAYPGAHVLVRGENYGFINHGTSYCNISKISIEAGNNSIQNSTGRSAGIETNKYGRFVGNTITDREAAVGSSGCADGGMGAIFGSAQNHNDLVSGFKAYGNHIFEWGCSNTHKYEHTTYIENRSGQDSGSGTNINVDVWEFGWNLLTDNKARGGLAAYDQNVNDSDPCGDVNGTLRVHDNVIVNQVGYTIAVGTQQSSSATKNCWSMPVEIYNNLLINVGIGPDGPDYDNDEVAISVGGRGMSSHVKIYNNTIYGTGDNLSSSGNNGALDIPESTKWNGTVEWVNNLVYDTDGTNFSGVHSSSVSTITVHSNNIWYSSTGALSPPSWDTNPRTSNPQFVNIGGNNFSLQEGSPARDSGSSAVSSVVNKDLTGIPRPQGSSYDIGAYEYDDNSISLPPITYTKPTITDLRIGNTGE